MTVFPGLFGAYPDDAVLVVVPTGPMGWLRTVDAAWVVRAGCAPRSSCE